MPAGKRNDPDAPRRVSILGSTGSIGTSTIDLIERNPAAYRVEALTAHRNAALLAEQAKRTGARLAAIADRDAYPELRDALAGTDVEIVAGPEGVIEAASRSADWIMAAIVGAAGFEPTLAAVRQGAIVALANKECLVCAGEILLAEIAASGATLLPVDSEHNAIFQVFEFERRDAVEKIILTASGGPFRTATLDEMRAATPAQAVAHPNWDMGAKISVDSATMMNKGLELIEAHHLFGMAEDRIDILVHPQSIIHSMVAYMDGSVLAQLGTPDMRTPISFTLGWPDRLSAPCTRLDLAEIGKLTFEAPDSKRFPALRIAREALQAGGAAPTILNASNEVAVSEFLGGTIGLLDIPGVVEDTLAKMNVSRIETVEDVCQVDRSARRTACEIVQKLRLRV